MRLLLVEDEIQLSEALTQILGKNKYVVLFMMVKMDWIMD